MHKMKELELTTDQKTAISSVFGEYRQVFVELDFPGQPISSDWRLLDDEEDLIDLLTQQSFPVAVRLVPAQEIGKTDGETGFLLERT